MEHNRDTWKTMFYEQSPPSFLSGHENLAKKANVPLSRIRCHCSLPFPKSKIKRGEEHVLMQFGDRKSFLSLEVEDLSIRPWWPAFTSRTRVYPSRRWLAATTSNSLRTPLRLTRLQTLDGTGAVVGCTLSLWLFGSAWGQYCPLPQRRRSSTSS